MRNTDCQKCMELVYSRKLYLFGEPTWGYGKIPSKVMFIGEAPGKYGCGVTGIPFTKDRSGEFFQSCLEASRLTKDSIYITNIVKCCPENNRTPSISEIKNCEPYLMQEIEEVNPVYIVPLGASAFSFFLGGIDTLHTKLGYAIKHAFIWDWKDKGIILTPMYHPAYALRTGKQKEYKEEFKFLMTIFKNLEGDEL